MPGKAGQIYHSDERQVSLLHQCSSRGGSNYKGDAVPARAGVGREAQSFTS